MGIWGLGVWCLNKEKEKVMNAKKMLLLKRYFVGFILLLFLAIINVV